MKKLERFKTFELTKEKVKTIKGGSNGQDAVMKSEMDGVYEELFGGDTRTRPTKRYSSRHGCTGDC